MRRMRWLNEHVINRSKTALFFLWSRLAFVPSFVKRNARAVVYGLCTVGVLWWLSGFGGRQGLWQVYKLRLVEQDLTRRVQALEVEHQKVLVKLDRFRKDPLAQEEAVREGLGYVRPNELTFEIE